MFDCPSEFVLLPPPSSSSDVADMTWFQTYHISHEKSSYQAQDRYEEVLVSGGSIDRNTAKRTVVPTVSNHITHSPSSSYQAHEEDLVSGNIDRNTTKHAVVLTMSNHITHAPSSSYQAHEEVLVSGGNVDQNTAKRTVVPTVFNTTRLASPVRVPILSKKENRKVTTTKTTSAAVAKVKNNSTFSSQPHIPLFYEPPRHSVREVRMWEKKAGRMYATLNIKERDRANTEIGRMRAQYL